MEALVTMEGSSPRGGLNHVGGDRSHHGERSEQSSMVSSFYFASPINGEGRGIYNPSHKKGKRGVKGEELQG